MSTGERPKANALIESMQRPEKGRLENTHGQSGRQLVASML